MPVGCTSKFSMLTLEPGDALAVAGTEDRARPNLVTLVASPDKSLADLGYQLRGAAVEEVLVAREGRVMRDRLRGGDGRLSWSVLDLKDSLRLRHDQRELSHHVRTRTGGMPAPRRTTKSMVSKTLIANLVSEHNRHTVLGVRPREDLSVRSDLRLGQRVSASAFVLDREIGAVTSSLRPSAVCGINPLSKLTILSCTKVRRRVGCRVVEPRLGPL